MHYSDCYKLLKTLRNRELAAQLKIALENLEKEANSPTFVQFLQDNTQSMQSIFALRQEYDVLQLKKVEKGIINLINTLEEQQQDDPTLTQILNILKDIQTTAYRQSLACSFQHSHFSASAEKYATHFIPFSQGSDPFKGSDFMGYCWGHSHRYGKLASQGSLNQLSVASDETLYDTFKTNWTFADILFRRVGWYFWVAKEMQLRQAIWNALKGLDDKHTLNFNFLINSVGFHSTALRMVGNGIEYYDNNYGLVKFINRENAVNFLASHLLQEARKNAGEISFITVYRLPYTNQADHDIFAAVPQSALTETASAPAEAVSQPTALTQAINALERYAPQLEKSNVKGKIKANEIQYLVQELKGLSAQEIAPRIHEILENKEHSLIINRGTGFYFFQSGFKSRSTTETLLQAIYQAASGNIPALQNKII
ncbi:hypothetical protein [Legionella septentrionalis]|uniref:hypothetical protein n=1 Tax=Legionella septentrionalis TaxID=2498109 RepID=UPI000F8D5DC4|nr:hypothetical protein [Legionella septentrionalis]RUR00619.1 hypothetical protein ELY11_02385 [Legionella septentrionalis]